MKKIILITLLTITRITAQEPTQAATKSGFGFRGLAIEAFGQYAFQPLTSDAVLTDSALGGNGQTQLNFKAPKRDGYGAGANIVLDITQNLSLVAGLQYKSLKSSYQYYNYNFNNTAASTTYTITGNQTSQVSYNLWSVNFGPRIRLPLYGGEFFAGLGAALLINTKYDISANFDYLKGYEFDVYSNGTTNQTYPKIKSYSTSIAYNFGVGGTLEIGYRYQIFGRLHLSVSLDVLYGTVSNLGKSADAKYTNTDGSSSIQTRAYRNSFALNESNVGNQFITPYGTLNITDIGIRGAISMRIF